MDLTRAATNGISMSARPPHPSALDDLDPDWDDEDDFEPTLLYIGPPIRLSTDDVAPLQHVSEDEVAAFLDQLSWDVAHTLEPGQPPLPAHDATRTLRGDDLSALLKALTVEPSPPPLQPEPDFLRVEVAAHEPIPPLMALLRSGSAGASLAPEDELVLACDAAPDEPCEDEIQSLALALPPASDDPPEQRSLLGWVRDHFAASLMSSIIMPLPKA